MAGINNSPLWSFSPKKFEEAPSWWGDVSSNLSLVYKPLANKLENWSFRPDSNFRVTSDMLSAYPTNVYSDLMRARSQAEFDNIGYMHTEMTKIRESLSINNSITSMLMAGILDPINLVPIPGAFGMGFVKGATRAIPSIAGLSAVQEVWRAERDPTHTFEESVYAISGSAFFGGLLSGTIGHLTRGMNVGKIGDTYNQAQLYDEGNPTSKIKTKRTKVRGLETPIEEPDIKSPIKISELLNQERPKNVRNLKENALGKLDDSQNTSPVFARFDKMENISVVGTVSNRFKAPLSGITVNKFLGDYTRVSRATKAGEINMKEGSVITNDSKWLFNNQVIIRTINDEYARYAGDLTGEPSKIVNVPISKIGIKIKNKLSKSDKISEDDFAREVTKAIVDASDNTRVINGQSVPQGAIVHEIPQVENTAKLVNSKMEEASKAGEEAGIWRTEDGIETEFKNDLNEYNRYYFPYIELKKKTNKTPHDIFMMNLEEKNLLTLLNDMEDKELFILLRQQKKEGASAKMEEILDTIIEQKEKNFKKYNSIKLGVQNKIDSIEKHIEESLQNNKEVLAQLDADYHTIGLTQNQLEYRNVLIKRLFEAYGLQDVTKATTKGKGTAKQEQLLKDLKDQLNAPASVAKEKYMKDLLNKLKTPATEAQSLYLKNLQKTITDTHFTKGSLMPPNEAHYLMRSWSEGSIRDNYDAFVSAILVPHFTKNPRGKLRQKLNEQLKPNATREQIEQLDIEKENAVIAQAKKQANKIINDVADGNYDNIAGKGQARFFLKRELDMPNYQLLKEHNGIADFIETDIRSISNTYHMKFGPSIEMAKLFQGDRLGERAIREAVHDVALRYADEINTKGSKAFQKKLTKQENELNLARDIALQRLGNADSGSLSNQLIRAGMQIGQITMLGKAMIASFADSGKIILSRGLKDVFGKYLKTWGTDLNERTMYGMAARDIEVTGESLGGLSNANKNRVVMSESVGSQQTRKLGRFGDKALGMIDDASNSFYNANGLNPWTDKLKQWVGVISADRILYSGAWLSKNSFHVKLPKTNYSIVYGKSTDGRVAFTNYNDRIIFIDEDAVKSKFKQKAWLNPKVKGVKPLEDGLFDTPDEWADFVLLHEIMHSKNPRVNEPNFDIAKNENLMNDLALKEFKKQKKKFKSTQQANKSLQHDLSILRQYGLSQRDLINIHKAWAKAGGEKTHKGKEIYYSNVQEWTDVDPELTARYIRAIRADQINTIVTPTGADKPLLSYGVIGRGDQQRQHQIFKMPIQFMAWAFAANNKIIMSSLQGRHKGQMSGMLAMLGLGFMSDYMRNPSYWNQKPLEEKIIKGVEYSGLTSYWLDINNSLEIMSDNKFGIRPSVGGGNLFADDLGDRIGEPFGPLGNITADVVKMLSDPNLSSNRRASIMRRLIPYNNLFYADWLFKGAQRNIMNFN